jgi:NAD(P)-dependent dehydrogenase (short-subunit alcohol dehydrogenase family)
MPNDKESFDYAKSKIRVNAVCPGYVDTAMMQRFTGGTSEGRQKVVDEEPVGRPATPDEIAGAAVWLCSEAAAFIVGHALVMDGGQTV